MGNACAGLGRCAAGHRAGMALSASPCLASRPRHGGQRSCLHDSGADAAPARLGDVVRAGIDRTAASRRAGFRRPVATSLAGLGAGSADAGRSRFPALLAASRRTPLPAAVASACGSPFARAALLAQRRALPSAGKSPADDARHPALHAGRRRPRSDRAVFRVLRGQRLFPTQQHRTALRLAQLAGQQRRTAPLAPCPPPRGVRPQLRQQPDHLGRAVRHPLPAARPQQRRPRSAEPSLPSELSRPVAHTLHRENRQAADASAAAGRQAAATRLARTDEPLSLARLEAARPSGSATRSGAACDADGHPATKPRQPFRTRARTSSPSAPECRCSSTTTCSRISKRR